MRRRKPHRSRKAFVRAAELAIAAPQVVALRTGRMLAAGASPGVADRAEFSRMWTEKVQAYWQSMFAMGAQVVRTQQEYARAASVQWWRLWMSSWSSPALLKPGAGRALVPGASQAQQRRAMTKLAAAGIAPVHRIATANARRLGKATKKR